MSEILSQGDSQTSAQPLCPYSAPIISEDFHCQHADQVVRRGGVEILCLDEVACHSCLALYSPVKQQVLDELELPDDLTQVPHSVLQKIQYGVVTGLQSLMDSRDTDVFSLIQQATMTYNSELPVQELARQALQVRLKRRNQRN